MIKTKKELDTAIVELTMLVGKRGSDELISHANILVEDAKKEASILVENKMFSDAAQVVSGVLETVTKMAEEEEHIWRNTV